MTMIAILGASGTIGSALARRLVRSGCRVLLLGRNGEKLAPLSAELGQPMETIDATDSQSLVDKLERAAEGTGGFDGLVSAVNSMLSIRRQLLVQEGLASPDRLRTVAYECRRIRVYPGFVINANCHDGIRDVPKKSRPTIVSTAVRNRDANDRGTSGEKLPSRSDSFKAELKNELFFQYPRIRHISSG